LVTNDAAVFQARSGVTLDCPLEYGSHVCIRFQVLGAHEDAGHVVAKRLVAGRQHDDEQGGLEEARECAVHQNFSGRTRA
jgi:hypothetical protein